jgi:hypothetical protein
LSPFFSFTKKSIAPPARKRIMIEVILSRGDSSGLAPSRRLSTAVAPISKGPRIVENLPSIL